MEQLTCQEFGEKSLVIRGDYETYKDVVRNVSGRYNVRLKGGPGWLVPKSNMARVKEILGKYGCRFIGEDNDEVEEEEEEESEDEIEEPPHAPSILHRRGIQSRKPIAVKRSPQTYSQPQSVTTLEPSPRPQQPPQNKVELQSIIRAINKLTLRVSRLEKDVDEIRPEQTLEDDEIEEEPYHISPRRRR